MNQNIGMDDCIREIEELHAFFQAWFAGELPKDEANFGRFSQTISPNFTIIGPNGSITDHDGITAVLRSAHGAGPFEIWIENASAKPLGSGLWLALYEEWQIRLGVKSVRQSSAIFEERADAPNGLVWRHVHETWINTNVEAD